ncbi:aldehyde dehydrogenase family protein [Ammoniphilus sp. YIM 78166]|uniref:aldehyde dehydrogenase family protein n=1 Tax=Ammoniphilus sp. YIM 78166 TaxID=1644106 RepID=UPI00196A1F29|nr:aldehyde dehydrogenase family protein [Ammoniphilus sp. YIM 78166]
MGIRTRSENEAWARTVLDREWKMLIGGELVEAQEGETFGSYSPATGEFLAAVPYAKREDVDHAVEAAKAAFPAWSKTPVLERVRMVRELIALLKEKAEILGLIDAVDSGNPVTAMIGDVHLAAAMLDYQCNAAMEVKGATIPSTSQHWHITRREPYGVVGRIIAYNHPILFAAAKIGAPVLTGNTLVLKVPDQTPLAPLLLAEYIKDIFPPGVVNIISGDGLTTGDALVRHRDVKRIALIGSVQTGQRILRSAAEVGIKHVSLELGGKNPMIVFPDADLDKAVEGAANGMNFSWSQGQSCGSTTRLFLHQAIHDEFVEKLRRRVEGIRIGQPLDPETEMGCLVSEAQFDKVNAYIQLGRDEGAECITGGGRPHGAEFEKGYFVRPTIFTQVTNDMRIAQEEIFGPVLSVIPWSDEEEVIRLANATDYGLTAAVWTQNINKAFSSIDQLQAGFTWINGSARHFIGVPFSGHKSSGLDSEEGIEELISFTQNKTVNVMIG